MTVAIHVHELEAGCLKTGDEHLREAGDQVVAEGRVVVALAAEAGAVELHGADGVDRAPGEVPRVRRQQPRPAEDLAGADGLDREPAASRWRKRRSPSA